MSSNELGFAGFLVVSLFVSWGFFLGGGRNLARQYYYLKKMKLNISDNDRRGGKS